MFIGVVGGRLLLAFGLLVGTRIGRVISLIIFALVVAQMVNGPSPDRRAEAMKAGTFSCEAALEDDTTFEADVWSYCGGKFGEAQWSAMVRAKTDAVWAEIAQKEADDKAASAAKEAGLTALGKRAARQQ